MLECFFHVIQQVIFRIDVWVKITLGIAFAICMHSVYRWVMMAFEMVNVGN